MRVNLEMAESGVQWLPEVSDNVSGVPIYIQLLFWRRRNKRKSLRLFNEHKVKKKKNLDSIMRTVKLKNLVKISSYTENGH